MAAGMNTTDLSSNREADPYVDIIIKHDGQPKETDRGSETETLHVWT